MHDAGKIGIPDRILLKPGRLDEDEWKIMRRHSQYDGLGTHGTHAEAFSGFHPFSDALMGCRKGASGLGKVGDWADGVKIG